MLVSVGSRKRSRVPASNQAFSALRRTEMLLQVHSPVFHAFTRQRLTIKPLPKESTNGIQARQQGMDEGRPQEAAHPDPTPDRGARRARQETALDDDAHRQGADPTSAPFVRCSTASTARCRRPSPKGPSRRLVKSWSSHGSRRSTTLCPQISVPCCLYAVPLPSPSMG